MKNLIKSAKSIWLCGAFCFAAIMLQSCVHEFPEINNNINVRLKIIHQTEWTEYDYFIGNSTDARHNSKAADDNNWKAKYTIMVYPKGDLYTPLKRISFTREDISLAEFEIDIELPVGEWDIYVWQDFTNRDVVPPFYNADNFRAISYEDPYRGDTDMRDAFEGMTSVAVPETMEADYVVNGEITMERPLAKYVFIATDFEDYYNDSMSRYNLPGEKSRWEALSLAQKREALKGFSVVARYPWYMPSVYDMFTQKVTDSWTGIHYDAEIIPINGEEAIIATDYVFINHHESGAQVQLGLRTPNGDLIGLTSTINVPLLRGRVTYVRGRFLTASTGSGLEIDFSFSGSFDIFIP